MAVTQLKNEKIWLCGASIHSGAYHASWKVDTLSVEKILSLWEDLIRLEDPDVPDCSTGYMGCYLMSSGGTIFTAYKGVISYLSEGRVLETRLNIDRMFEIYILSTAPEGSIPDKIIELEFVE